MFKWRCGGIKNIKDDWQTLTMKRETVGDADQTVPFWISEHKSLLLLQNDLAIWIWPAIVWPRLSLT